MRNHIKLLIATLAISACSSGDNGVTAPPPTPPAEKIIVQITGDTTFFGANAVVNASVQASSSKSPFTDNSFVWTLNGATAGKGWSVSLTLNPGPNPVCVTAQGRDTSATACTTFVFTPKIICKVVVANSADEKLSAPLRATFTKGSVTATKDVGLDGDCGIESPLALEDSVRAVLDAPPGATRTIHPMIAYLARSDLTKSDGATLIGVPASFQIGGNGRFQGLLTPISLDLGFIPGDDGISFFTRTKDPATGRYLYMVASHTDLPLGTAILQTPQQIIPSLATLMWTGLDSLNTYLGWNVSRPLASNEAPDTTGSKTAVIRMDSTKCASGATACAGSYSWDGKTILAGGVMYLRTNNITYASSTHEFIHILGFGHGCGWVGIMSMFCSKGIAMTPSQKDVAYIQLYYRIVELTRKYHTHISICESHQGERVLVKGLPEEFCSQVHPY